jgi:hypothetical protein
MSDPKHHPQHDEQFDTEIDVRRIGWFLVWLSVGAIVTCVAMYVLYRDFRAREEKADLPPSPLVDRSVPRLPPEPRLQVTAEKDLRQYRAEQDALIRTYGWVDEPLGVVRIPIDRAMDMVAAQQLPWRPHAAPAPAGAGGIPPASTVGASGAAAAPATGAGHAPPASDATHSGGRH